MLLTELGVIQKDYTIKKEILKLRYEKEAKSKTVQLIHGERSFDIELVIETLYYHKEYSPRH